MNVQQLQHDNNRGFNKPFRDITSEDQHDIILRLERNDPALTAIKISISQNSSTSLNSLQDFERVGRTLANNTNLNTLFLRVTRTSDGKRQFESHSLRLVELLCENRSICHFQFKGSGHEIMEFFQPLEVFLSRNDGLKSLEVIGCNISYFTMAFLMTALSNRRCQLENIKLEDVTNEGLSEMVSWFRWFDARNQAISKRMSFRGIYILDEDCSNLAKVIENNNIRFEEIDLHGNRFIGPNGWRLISSALAGQHYMLQRLNASQCRLNDAHMDVLTKIFSANPNMMPDKIILSMNEISLEGIQSLGNLLVKRISPVKELDLSGNDAKLIGWRLFINSFVSNPTKTPLDLRLRDCGIRGELYRDIARLVQLPMCSLEKLFLKGNSRLDSGRLYRILDSLKFNATLRELSLPGVVTVGGWHRLLSHICDETDICATYSSNHSLICFDSPTVPREIIPYLEMNKIQDKKAVATLKVIRCHFACNFNVRLFEDMEVPVLVKVMYFVNRGFAIQDDHKEYLTEKERDHRDRNYNCLSIHFVMVKNIPGLVHCRVA